MEYLTVLLIYSLSVYGIAWTITKSRLFLFYRSTIQSILVKSRDRFVNNSQNLINKIVYKTLKEWNYFSNCIVCTSAWVGVLLSIFANETSILHSYITVVNMLDLAIWAGFCSGTTWLIASQVGDAD